MPLIARLLWWLFLGEALLNLLIAGYAFFFAPDFLSQFTTQTPNPITFYFLQSWAACLAGLGLFEGTVLLLRKDEALLAVALCILLVGDALFVSSALIYGLASRPWPVAVVVGLVVTTALAVFRLVWLFLYEQRRLARWENSKPIVYEHPHPSAKTEPGLSTPGALDPGQPER